MSKYCIGIDLGGTFIKFCLLDENLQASDIFQLPTPTTGAKDVINQMVAGGRQLMTKRGLTANDVLGVGIGSPGPMKITEGVLISLANIPGMENVPLRDEVAKGIGIHGVLENDANAAAFGEYLCGAGGTGDMVMLTLGTGVGGGIIIDGKVLHGAHEIGAEIGHMIIVPDGEQCGCGQRGCLERYTSATYIAKWATRLIEQEKRQSSLKAILDSGKEINTRNINEARKAGDALAAEVWDKAMYYLAIGCINVARILDPEKIVLAGGLTGAGDDMMIPLRKHYQALHWKATPPLTTLEIAKLGNDAGTIGAAGVAWQHFGPRK